MDKEGYNYVFDTDICATCSGKCCTGESGYIYVSSAEIENIARFLKISRCEFEQKYLTKVEHRYSIIEERFKDGYKCVFFDEEHKCTIYKHRPLQCKTFPFWEYFKNKIEEVKEECPAVLDK